MIYFSKDEKCAMIIGLTHICCSNESKGIARSTVMLRYQDMLGIDHFDTLEFSNTKNDQVLPTLKGMSNEKKKFYVQMMLALLLEGGKIDNKEFESFLLLCVSCEVPNYIVKEVIEAKLGKRK